MNRNKNSNFATFDINRRNKLKKYGLTGRRRAPTFTQPADIEIPLDERKGLDDLEANDCRWPFGDPKEEGFHFCNRKQSAGGYPYCEHHTNRARRQE